MMSALACSQIRQSSRHVCEVTPLACTLTESQLIQSMIESNEYAWIEFHNRYRTTLTRSISRIAARFPSRLTEEDRREVYASLILKLMENDMHKLRCYNPERGCKFTTWLCMLAIQSCYDYLRCLRNEPQFTNVQEAYYLPCHQPTPHDELVKKQIEEALADMVSTLTATDQLFVSLYFRRGLEPEQVARRLRISVKTVYSKKHKICMRLEKLIQSYAAA